MITILSHFFLDALTNLDTKNKIKVLLKLHSLIVVLAV